LKRILSFNGLKKGGTDFEVFRQKETKLLELKPTEGNAGENLGVELPERSRGANHSRRCEKTMREGAERQPRGDALNGGVTRGGWASGNEEGGRP